MSTNRLAMPWFFAVALLASAAAWGHGSHSTEALLILKSDGNFQLDLHLELEELRLAEISDQEQQQEHLRGLFQRRLRVRFDGEPASFGVSFPGGDRVRLEGEAPGGARQVTFTASRAFGLLDLTILDQATLSGRRESLEPGASSAAFALGHEQASTPSGP